MIFKNEDLKSSKAPRPIPEFSWSASPPFSEISKSKHLRFDIQSLDPGKYSFPYHIHRAAEELFYIIQHFKGEEGVADNWPEDIDS